MPESPLRVTYIGHATTLLELDGVQILTDPPLFAFANFEQFFLELLALRHRLFQLLVCRNEIASALNNA